MHLAFLLAVVTLNAPAGPDTAVVCPPAYVKALEPWLTYRAAQGHRFAMIADVSSPESIRKQIREAAKGDALRDILIVGDAPSLDVPKDQKSLYLVPTHYEPAKVIQRFGPESEIATDNWYADLDDDGVPDLAIGRLPVNNPWQLALVVKKILAYEKSNDLGPWRRKINLVAGVGNFGLVADTVIDTATRRLITEGIPAQYETTLTHANWHSPYCPAPSKFCATTVNRLNEGCLFFVYLGHGFPYRCANVESPEGEFPILATTHATQLKCDHGAPIAVFMACYTGAFDASKGCLGEELILAEGGPVAVIGGTRTTMPYGMCVLSMSLLDECFHKRRATLGEILLNAKRRSVSDEPPSAMRKVIDNVASVVSPEASHLAEERLEHLQLINLLGDPLLGIRQPQPMPIKVKEIADAGEAMEIVGVAPLAGKCVVQLSCRRDRLTFSPPARRKYDGSSLGIAACCETYDRANDTRWTEKTVALNAGEFRLSLPIPAEARGASNIRFYLEGADDFAMGAAEIFIREPRKSP